MRKMHVIIASLGIVTLVLTCQKLDFDQITKIQTVSVSTGLDYIKAQCKVVELSSNDHSEFGFCYGITPGATVNGSKQTIDNLKVGDHNITISGLTANTTYYIRSYCKEGGTYIYGEEVQAKTSIETLKDVDNNTYNAIEIGTQVWMQENLKVIHYRNGDPITNVTADNAWSSTTSGAYCWYDNNPSNKDTYGALYNFYNVEDSRNLCPSGWHVPSDAEWTTLSNYLGGDDISGGKLKEFGLSHWNHPNTDATNSSGFSALPAGYREFDGAFNSLGDEGKWWSRTLNDLSTAFFRYIYNNYSTLFNENFKKNSGLSIRCIKGDLVVVPTLTTTAVSALASTAANSGGNITSDGGAAVTARGVCWGTSSNPVATGYHTADATGNGIFTSSITGLTPNTIYYVRAYATNSAGTGYGNEITITTTTNVTDYDGNTYNTVQIGSQLWMQENLKTTKYRDGTSIQNVTDNTAWINLTSGAYCWYNNDATAYKPTYGAMYNYYTLIDNHNLCPMNWHVPTDEDWHTLVLFLDANATFDYTESSIAGGKLKATTLWTSSNTGVDNSSGFTGFPGGSRTPNGGYFQDIGNIGFWWSTSAFSPSEVWTRYLYKTDINRPSYPKNYGFSVRCLKDN